MKSLLNHLSKTTPFFVLLLAVFLSGCIINADDLDIDRIQGSGLLETESIAVEDFSRVSMAIPGELYITQGDEESLTLSAQANLIPFINVFVEDNRLHIETDEDIQIQPTRTIVIELSVIQLRDLVFAGDGLVKVDTLASTNFSTTLAGSGDIEVDQLSAVLLNTTLAGSGDMFFAGTIEEQRINLAGSGDIEARELESQITDIEIAGSGSATVNVTDELKASIVGSGSVRYLGNPTVETTIVGSGTVSPLGN